MNPFPELRCCKLLAKIKLVITARRTPEIACTVMKSPSFIGVFSKRLDFLQKVLSKAGKKIEVRSLKMGTMFKEPDRVFVLLGWGGISL